MVRLRDDDEACACAKPFDDRGQQREVGKSVTITLQKQHRHVHFRKVFGARDGRPTGGVQRKSEEDAIAYVRARLTRFRERRQ